MKSAWTYAKSGVQIPRIRATQNQIGKLIEQTYRYGHDSFGTVLSKFGHYAGLIDIGHGKAAALHTDGVGTKVLVAQLLEKYDTIGIDCVAMCVNDIICVGAEPIALADYIALEQMNDKQVKEIMKGLVAGAREARVAIVGGETAILPELFQSPHKGRGYDLAATCLGIVDRGKTITGDRIALGDEIIGLMSSGIHSNGLTLARNVFAETERGMLARPPELRGLTVATELLKPTVIYVKPIMKVIGECEVHALANITGGAFSKLSRFWDYTDYGFELNQMPRPQAVFQLIQRQGNVSEKEMYRTFNMGIGFCIVAPPNQTNRIIAISKRLGFKAQKIGKISQSRQISLTTASRTVRLE